ncbi:hypothetical protein RJ639_037207 [Escallonia herrerae]|uniref:Reverse transcriptase/retrotransposon-derived protein RNase H-like domain-containing protein n=1 Tax=Escallonia herrerae TaxID=1293975 RepID=A0AA88X1M3_9ASTE|nr:hypothetical protein RJ639_037207 [Escallonia herrerae]
MASNPISAAATRTTTVMALLVNRVAPATKTTAPVTVRTTTETVTALTITTVIPPRTSAVLPPLQPVGMTNIAPPIVENQAELMVVILAMQQSIERLQSVIENPPPQSEPPRPPSTFKTPEQTSHHQHMTQTEDEEFDGKRQNLRCIPSDGVLEDWVKPITSPLYGFTGLNRLQAIASTYHLLLKFPTPRGVGFMKRDQTLARRCYVASCRPEETVSIDDQRDKATRRRIKPVEALIHEYLASSPLLSKPISRKELFLYLAVAESAVSAVLIREEDGRQLPIYYVSKVLQGAEQRSPSTEKLAFALLIATRKLWPNFQSHTIVVLTDKPLRQIMHNPDLSGHLVPWSVELGEFEIRYRPRPSIKGQALGDFIIECILPIEDEETLLTPRPKLFVWTLFIGGSSNANRSGANYTLREVHEGICGQHLGGQRALEHKVLRQGYYWPTMQQDTMSYTKKCDACQRFSSIPRQAPSLLGVNPRSNWVTILRLTTYDPVQNEEALHANLDLLDEWREQATMCLAAYQNRVSKFYDQRVARAFQVGDLVLHCIEYPRS